MKALQIIKYSLLASMVALIVGFLHYNLPRTDVVQIKGTDVKRLDRRHSGDVTKTRDVRYLSTVTRKDKVRVFRNEDTGWGWPPYLKFDSADLTARAQLLVQDPEKPWVRVRYYGWRIKVLTLFPNAVSLKVVDKNYTHLPIFNIVFVAVLIVVGVVVWLSLRRLLGRLRNSERFQSLSRSVTDRFGDGQR
ncbi:MAG: DUF1523 family protein [Gammaproteobacteria bacterium]|nr:DUF1523 family protein [Gammaproteobacteria bacterium]